MPSHHDLFYFEEEVVQADCQIFIRSIQGYQKGEENRLVERCVEGAWDDDKQAISKSVVRFLL